MANEPSVQDQSIFLWKILGRSWWLGTELSPQTHTQYDVFELKNNSKIFVVPGCNYCFPFFVGRLFLIVAMPFNFAVVGNRRKNTHTLSHDPSWKADTEAVRLLWDIPLVWAVPGCKRASSWLSVSAKLKPKLPVVCSEWSCGESYLNGLSCLAVVLSTSVITKPEEWVFSSSKSDEKAK